MTSKFESLENLEWWSTCCTAPPMYDLHIDEITADEPLGMCMFCRDHATFELLEDE